MFFRTAHPLAGIVLALFLPFRGFSAGDAVSPSSYENATNLLQTLKTKLVPDGHLVIWQIGIGQNGSRLALTGTVDHVEFKVEAERTLKEAGIAFDEQLTTLPPAKLGDRLWGIVCVSVANGREAPEHKAELGTQVLMGQTVRLWNQSTNRWPWYQAESADGYHAWIEEGQIIPCTCAQMQDWTNSALLIVTAYEAMITEKPIVDAQPVSDAVFGDLVKLVKVHGHWYQVQLPDGRSGYLPRAAADDYRKWKQTRHATAEAIEQRARSFMGRPYLWGANSPKGMDCSGFTKLVFFANGIDLRRNASEQAHEGTEIPLDPDYSRLKKGDLLFFGRQPRDGKPENIFHAGIYLGDKLFIQSSESVRLSSLDPASPIFDEHRYRTLLHVRRVLPERP